METFVLVEEEKVVEEEEELEEEEAAGEECGGRPSKETHPARRVEPLHYAKYKPTQDRQSSWDLDRF